MKSREIIALGDLQVDLGARRVSRDGVELQLGRLSFDLLEALIRASPSALSNEQIVAHVWSGDAVTDENIKQRVSLLRRALGQEAGREYVETLRGYGYRLAEEPRALTPLETGAPRPPARSNRLARRLLLVLAITSLLLLITVLAIAMRQLKRMRLGAAPSTGAEAAAQLEGTGLAGGLEELDQAGCVRAARGGLAVDGLDRQAPTRVELPGEQVLEHPEVVA